MYRLYIKEFSYRSFYVLISLSLCVCVVFFNIELFFLIETYSFLKLGSKQFLALNVTDFIDVIWTLSVFMSTIFIYPLFLHHACSFFKNCWYDYQTYFVKKVVFKSYALYIISLIFCYIHVLPLVFCFLFQWEAKSLKTILSIKVELNILSYTLWVISFKHHFSYTLHVILLVIAAANVLFNFLKVYHFFKTYKKHLSFYSLVLIFLFSPPDVYLQFMLVLFIFLSAELVFLVMCYLITNFSSLIKEKKCLQYNNY
uniref:Sec-independent protein translocase n=1 Tax=Caulacanthus okamurae TaxID=152008 RepID=A0A6H1UAT9_9FLOR|nr:Sec-independent protein translocase [Caulacanthus okamurae]QIZ74789.1 Sec-independent protein translocase [Caulacanthus okamurae]